MKFLAKLLVFSLLALRQFFLLPFIMIPVLFQEKLSFLMWKVLLLIKVFHYCKRNFSNTKSKNIHLNFQKDEAKSDFLMFTSPFLCSSRLFRKMRYFLMISIQIARPTLKVLNMNSFYWLWKIGHFIFQCLWRHQLIILNWFEKVWYVRGV